jgi:hypothetical protein
MKVKITTEVDIDLEKFFGVEKSAKKDYLVTSIYEIIRDAYIKQIEDNCYWKFEQKQFYEDVKHHKLIDIELSKQLLDNLNIHAL